MRGLGKWVHSCFFTCSHLLFVRKATAFRRHQVHGERDAGKLTCLSHIWFLPCLASPPLFLTITNPSFFWRHTEAWLLLASMVPNTSRKAQVLAVAEQLPGKESADHRSGDWDHRCSILVLTTLLYSTYSSSFFCFFLPTSSFLASFLASFLLSKDIREL